MCSVHEQSCAFFSVWSMWSFWHVIIYLIAATAAFATRMRGCPSKTSCWRSETPSWQIRTAQGGSCESFEGPLIPRSRALVASCCDATFRHDRLAISVRRLAPNVAGGREAGCGDLIGSALLVAPQLPPAHFVKRATHAARLAQEALLAERSGVVDNHDAQLKEQDSVHTGCAGRSSHSKLACWGFAVCSGREWRSRGLLASP